ncbi:MAG: GNAT family N-acetyltransferase [Ilumatobacter sp.]|nr:GNAT family N-acetyltransferase [Ilumatobacter sp.]
MEDVVHVFQQVWGSVTEIVRLEMLMAIAHSGGYVAAAYDVRSGPAERIVGASVALLARHHDRPALHSHVTGILPGARSAGLGRAMKLHQQQWAAARDIEWIVWTFDPLVRHNAFFNIAVLGADVHGYLPHFYGTMTDALNAGDDSDRLLVAWSVTTDPSAGLRDGGGLDAGTVDRVATPEDIMALRRTDPAAVRQWRIDTRDKLSAALAAGRPVVGFTRSGDYLIGVAP